MSYATALRNKTRELARSARHALGGQRRDGLRLRPWAPIRPQDVPAEGAWCVLCDWRGPQFPGPPHSEAAQCPNCQAVGRDRFLYLCLYQRVPYDRRLRVLETSPRLGAGYRDTMARRVRYLASDYDERAHKASVKLDLQRLDLADASIDVLITAHVLEHVPDTDASLSEIYRVLSPGGRMLLQVPVGQATTAPPPEPEFHGDNTPVFWRFGMDLTERLRQHGFQAVVLCTEDFRRRVVAGDAHWERPFEFPEFDHAALVGAANADDLVVVADEQLALRDGVFPSYQFLTWEAVKPAGS
jgi:SAM-dependent methyltransferase